MSDKLKILIVEDRDVDRRLLRKMLEGGGYEVHEASDGREGLEKAGLYKPDMIISDALMPGMDGFRFLRKVRTDTGLKSIPFIFYSAVYTGRMDEKLAFSLGARAFIEKPAGPDEFLEKVKTVLQEIQAGKESASVELVEEEEEYLRRYSQVVAAKLEEKVDELEGVNECLQQEIAEHKKAEEALQKAHDELEMRVKKRTAELEGKNTELESYNKLFVNRELRINELKERIKELEGE